MFQNEYMKDDFMIKIETWHKPDMGTIENVSANTCCRYVIVRRMRTDGWI